MVQIVGDIVDTQYVHHQTNYYYDDGDPIVCEEYYQFYFWSGVAGLLFCQKIIILNTQVRVQMHKIIYM